MAQTWTYDLQESHYDGAVTPSVSEIPHTFDEPIHAYMHFKYDCGTTQSWTGEKHVECNVEFDITGFLTDKYPLLFINLGDENSAGFGFDKGGIMYNNLSGTFNGQPVADLSSLHDTFASWWNVDGVFTIYDTNIPIFFRYPNQTGYMSYNTFYNTYKPYANPIPKAQMETVVNYGESETPESPDGIDFELRVAWTSGTWLNDTQPQVTSVYYQYVRAKLTGGKFSLYKIDGINDNKLKYGILSTATFYEMEYSTDGRTWTPTETFPFEFIYRRREKELGTFGYALYVNNDTLPIWESEEDAQDYIDGNKILSDASNWDKISSKYPYENLTEDEDTGTTFGGVYTRAFFSQQYICSATALQEISNAFFDTTQGGISGIFEDIKKGLEMYGESVVDAVQGCMFFPLDLTTVFTSVQSQNYIYFGGFKFDLQNSSVNKIIYPNGYKDFGSFEIVSTFGKGNIRNYAPYQRLYAYLPYIGFVELDLSKYLDKTANVRYYFDTRTGTCLACITANGILIDYFNGQCGVSMPVTMTDFSRYAQTQIQTLLSGGANMGGGGNVGEMVKSGANNFVGGLAESGAVGLGTVAVGGLAMAGAVQGAKTLYGLTQNNINNFKVTKGASSSMLNQYLPQEVLFWFEIQDDDETPYENALQGYPSNASGRIQDFDGFLAVDTVKLNCAYATDNERAEIIAYLKSGVYL